VANVPESQAAPPAGGGVYHTVQYGETLFSIGRLYGIYPYKIAEVNDLANPNCIYAGQVLYIPASDGWSDCGNCGCGNTCPSPRPQPCRYPGCQYPTYGHGYDYSGYYYYNTYPTYRRYSYTCGYYHNCY
jgi:LysM repeat protein